MALTDTEIRRSKPAERPYKLSDDGGLLLLITPAGGRLWRWNCRFDGTEKLMALGRYPGVALAEARERRDATRKKLANDIDPMAERMAENTAIKVATEHTFGKIAELWLEHLEGKHERPSRGNNGESPQGECIPRPGGQAHCGSEADGTCPTRQGHRNTWSLRDGEAVSSDRGHGLPLRRRPQLQQTQPCR